MAGFDGLARIGQIALTVGNLAEATAFYRDDLGMTFLFEVPGMAFFDCAGTRLLLGEAEGGEDGAEAGGGAEPEGGHSATILYFEVDDIEAAHATLAGRGVGFVEEPRKVAELESTELWLAFFRDPWQNTLALMSER